jgi:hypothetical protein
MADCGRKFSMSPRAAESSSASAHLGRVGVGGPDGYAVLPHGGPGHAADRRAGEKPGTRPRRRG